MTSPDKKLSIRSRAPSATSAQTRSVMRSMPSADTAPEIKLRKILHQKGLRFFKNRKPIPGIRATADIVFPTAKVCVFVDGCFWHGCPQHFHAPKSNTEWWIEKVADNKRRDASKTAQIESLGWRVLRFWEHELKGEAAYRTAATVYKCVRGLKRAPSS